MKKAINVLRSALWPLNLIYGGIVWVRNTQYDLGYREIYQSKAEIISIGNISTGGTGKTPMAEYMIRSYLEAGETHVAYLSRGYGRKTKGLLKVNPAEGTAVEFGDEALQIAARFPAIPVVVCEDRKTGIQWLEREEKAKVIIMDDAFQHRKVSRNIDVVVIDATRMPDKDLLLPAGNLREPARSLHRADFIIVNKVESVDLIAGLRQRLQKWNKPLFFCRPVIDRFVFPGGTQNPETGSRVVLFSGIGNAGSFVSLVETAGYEVAESVDFRDHHYYHKAEVEALVNEFREMDAGFLFTTEKDYWRLRGSEAYQALEGVPWGYIQIRLEWWEKSPGENVKVERSGLPQ
ncbi:MAG: tetraacyldisaccharide 4'-kinase [Bacteroidia bacterium]